nr:MAG TPA: hypothetical protein [Caudoviricetes sp.]
MRFSLNVNTRNGTGKTPFFIARLSGSLHRNHAQASLSSYGGVCQP